MDLRDFNGKGLVLLIGFIIEDLNVDVLFVFLKNREQNYLLF